MRFVACKRQKVDRGQRAGTRSSWNPVTIFGLIIGLTLAGTQLEPIIVVPDLTTAGTRLEPIRMISKPAGTHNRRF